MRISCLFATVLAMTFWGGTAVQAQSAPSDMMIVLDGSGSMWGQINGRSKIEIARDTLTQVLEETVPEMQIGMIAYGHRAKGDCSDIETLVPVSPAAQSVPLMISAAEALKPKGKTPLSDAVRLAAQTMRYTENAATVVLVTDGIETCDADPCALAAELEDAGIDFTAHVVGFGLSADEGRQVQCLADLTGGLFLSAQDAGTLQSALQQTLEMPEIAANEADFGPATRNVHFMIRDTEDSPLLGVRQLNFAILQADGTPAVADSYGLNYPEASDRSATADLAPGLYTAAITREGIYDAQVEFEVPQGDGIHTVVMDLAARLAISPYLNPNMPLDTGNPPPSSVKSTAWSYYSIFPMQDGKIATTPLVKQAYQDLDFPLAAGTYMIRANLDRTTSAEQIVTVAPGGTTTVDFSFDVTRVFIEAVQADGQQVNRQTTYFYDKLRSGRNYFASGGGVRNGEVIPFYLPTGTFVVNVGAEGGGARRSEFVLNVPGDYADIHLSVGEGMILDEAAQAIFTAESYQACKQYLSVKYKGCLKAEAVAAQ